MVSTGKLHCSSLMWFVGTSEETGAMQHRRMFRGSVTVLLASATLCAGASIARADAIDGEWCREGRHFAISGPDIFTWGGTRMKGDYDRHGFKYTVPPNEPEAGAEIAMVLRGEELVFVFKKPKGATASGEPEPWRRCKVTS